MRFLSGVHIDWVLRLVTCVIPTVVGILLLFPAPPEKEREHRQRDECNRHGDSWAYDGAKIGFLGGCRGGGRSGLGYDARMRRDAC